MGDGIILGRKKKKLVIEEKCTINFKFIDRNASDEPSNYYYPYGDISTEIMLGKGITLKDALDNALFDENNKTGSGFAMIFDRNSDSWMFHEHLFLLPSKIKNTIGLQEIELDGYRYTRNTYYLDTGYYYGDMWFWNFNRDSQNYEPIPLDEMYIDDYFGDGDEETIFIIYERDCWFEW